MGQAVLGADPLQTVPRADVFWLEMIVVLWVGQSLPFAHSLPPSRAPGPAAFSVLPRPWELDAAPLSIRKTVYVSINTHRHMCHLGKNWAHWFLSAHGLAHFGTFMAHPYHWDLLLASSLCLPPASTSLLHQYLPYNTSRR